MAYRIDESRCVGCGACHFVCVLKAAEPVDDYKEKYKINEEKCRDCGQCELICPNSAVSKV